MVDVQTLIGEHQPHEGFYPYRYAPPVGGLWGKVRKAFKSAGQRVERTGKSVYRRTKRTVRSVKRRVKKVGRKIRKSLKSVGQHLKKVIKDYGYYIAAAALAAVIFVVPGVGNAIWAAVEWTGETLWGLVDGFLGAFTTDPGTAAAVAESAKATGGSLSSIAGGIATNVGVSFATTEIMKLIYGDQPDVYDVEDYALLDDGGLVLPNTQAQPVAAPLEFFEPEPEGFALSPEVLKWLGIGAVGLFAIGAMKK